MNWTQIFTSSIGKKLVMAITGISLILFLVVHCYINALMFFDDSGHLFTEAATFMSETIFIRIMEIGLFLGFLVHIIEGIYLWITNAQKRPVKYKVKAGNKTSKWYSRYMGILGSLILIFLIVHLGHYWLPNRTGAFAEESEMFEKMKTLFALPGVVTFYVIACVALAYHLIHGFQSAFRTMGWLDGKYASTIQMTGTAFSVIICGIFAAMPIWMYFHFS